MKLLFGALLLVLLAAGAVNLAQQDDQASELSQAEYTDLSDAQDEGAAPKRRIAHSNKVPVALTKRQARIAQKVKFEEERSGSITWRDTLCRA